MPLGLTATPYVLANPGQVTLTSGSNLAGINFIIAGRDNTGAVIGETIAGPNANTIASVNVYAAIDAFLPLGTSASTLTMGYSAIAQANPQVASKFTLFSGANLSAINFAIVGTLTSGTVQSETLAGPNAGFSTTVNSYAALCTIKSSAAVSSNIQVGNPAILSGISICPNGGDF